MCDLKLADYVRAIPDFPKPGILFRDITPLLADAAALRQAVAALAERFRPKKVDLVAAVEARGFILGGPVAIELQAGFVPVRKPRKLPARTLSCCYDLEYGTDTIEMHADAVPPGAQVLVVDDLLATGGTVEACCRLIEMAGGTVTGCAFLIELAEFGGVKKIAQYDVFSLIKYD